MLTPRERLKIRCRSSHRERYWDEVDREPYECPSCGYEPQGLDREFHVHHIDGDPFNGHFVNLVALCYHCHKHAHRATREKADLDEWKGRADEMSETEPEIKPTIGVRPVADGGEPR